MAQAPAVVIIARHGPRLDAADQSWHLSTPTPYDPPLTYGGWNQCRSLGARIASLLHAREQAANDALSEPSVSDGVTAHDFAHQNGGVQHRRKRRRKHKVVIHSSPFLRCVQTSVAIAAGMAQYQPPHAAAERDRPTMSRSRTPNTLHSSKSPRLRALEGSVGSPNLAPITEPMDFAHTLARKVLSEHKRHRRCKVRVDAFLGEWLNPQYFDHITPPPPSALMLISARGKLMEHESVDIFTPAPGSKPSSSLWGGADLGTKKRGGSKDSTDSWEEEGDAPLPAPTARRDRTSSMSSLPSPDISPGRRSPFRPGSHHGSNHHHQHHHSSVPKPETSVYVPPKPQYAISSHDEIPKGYVAHARQACTNPDFSWDSSRPGPQDWGDGGVLGEEWSAMHKRFRKGVGHLVEWYSQHNIDDRAEDALGFDQAEHHAHEEDTEEEDLVVVMVTHGAGANALIGALTGQPVLLDVGMGSLTMAVRREDTTTGTAFPVGGRESPATDAGGLPGMYEMKLISSSEHLRPGSAKPPAGPQRSGSASSSSGSRPMDIRRAASPASNGSASRFQDPDRPSSMPSAGIMAGWNLNDPINSVGGAVSGISRKTGGTSSMLGSAVRRPSNVNVGYAMERSGSGNNGRLSPGVSAQPGSPGLWTSPGSAGTAGGEGSPSSSDGAARPVEGRRERDGGESTSSPPMGSSSDEEGVAPDVKTAKLARASKSAPRGAAMSLALSGALDSSTEAQKAAAQSAIAHAANGITATTMQPPASKSQTSPPSTSPPHDHKPSLSSLTGLPAHPPQALGRTLSQKGLWGSKPGGDEVARFWGEGPKRRWTVSQKGD